MNAALDWWRSHVPYGVGSRGGRSASKAGADCSGAVWCIYKQSGLPYGYMPARQADFAKSCSFSKLPSGHAPETGDVGVYGDKHAVIYDSNAASNPTKPSLKMDVWSASHPNGPTFGPGQQGWYLPQGPLQWYRYNSQGCK